MKILKILMPFYILLLASCAHNTKEHVSPTPRTFPITLENETRIDRIQEDVYVATELQFYKSNILVTRMKDGTVVLVSSPYENQSTRRLVHWVKMNLKPKKIIAINTHFHLDGTGGNQVYHEEGVETWATKMTAHLQMTEGKRILPLMWRNHKPSIQERIKNTHLEPAKNLFDAKKGKTFNFSGEIVKVFYPGEAHSPDNIVLYIPSKKLLFGGCMIKPKSLGWLRHANVKSWEQSAKNLLQFDVDQVVPGHGKWGDKSLLQKTIEVAKKAALQPDILTKDFD